MQVYEAGDIPSACPPPYGEIEVQGLPAETRLPFLEKTQNTWYGEIVSSRPVTWNKGGLLREKEYLQPGIS